MILAWDIETCPVPLDAMSPPQRRRYDIELRRYLERHPGADPDDASRLVRSIHPMLGWICCISAVALYDADQGMRPARSYTAGLREHEDLLLARFWEDVSRLDSRNVTFVTFNGKRFDVPFLRARTWAHGLTPTCTDLLDTYPFRDHPHCDLARYFEHMSLDDVCDLLGVESPKGALDGAGVAEAVHSGRIADVAAYCERDVVATLSCYLRICSSL